MTSWCCTGHRIGAIPDAYPCETPYLTQPEPNPDDWFRTEVRAKFKALEKEIREMSDRLVKNWCNDLSVVHDRLDALESTKPVSAAGSCDGCRRAFMADELMCGLVINEIDVDLCGSCIMEIAEQRDQACNDLKQTLEQKRRALNERDTALAKIDILEVVVRAAEEVFRNPHEEPDGAKIHVHPRLTAMLNLRAALDALRGDKTKVD